MSTILHVNLANSIKFDCVGFDVLRKSNNSDKNKDVTIITFDDWDHAQKVFDMISNFVKTDDNKCSWMRIPTSDYYNGYPAMILFGTYEFSVEASNDVNAFLSDNVTRTYTNDYIHKVSFVHNENLGWVYNVEYSNPVIHYAFEGKFDFEESTENSIDIIFADSYGIKL